MVFRVKIKKEIFVFSAKEDFSSSLLVKILSTIAIVTLLATLPGWIMLVESYKLYVSLREIGIYVLNTTLLLLLIPLFAIAKPPATLQKVTGLKTKSKTVPTSRFLASISILSIIIALTTYLAITISGLT